MFPIFPPGARRSRSSSRSGGRPEEARARAAAGHGGSRQPRVQLHLDARADRTGRGRRDSLDEPAVAPRLYEGLAAYADRISVISLSLSEMGPISRALGMLAGLQGDHALAEEHLVDALATSERIGSPPHATRTRVELARVLLDRRAEGDVERARELLDVALPAARELGMGRVLLDVLQLKSALS